MKLKIFFAALIFIFALSFATAKPKSQNKSQSEVQSNCNGLWKLDLDSFSDILGEDDGEDIAGIEEMLGIKFDEYFAAGVYIEYPKIYPAIFINGEWFYVEDEVSTITKKGDSYFFADDDSGETELILTRNGVALKFNYDGGETENIELEKKNAKPEILTKEKAEQKKAELENLILKMVMQKMMEGIGGAEEFYENSI